MRIPIIFGVLTTLSIEQARERAYSPLAASWADSALSMSQYCGFSLPWNPPYKIILLYKAITPSLQSLTQKKFIYLLHFSFDKMNPKRAKRTASAAATTGSADSASAATHIRVPMPTVSSVAFVHNCEFPFLTCSIDHCDDRSDGCRVRLCDCGVTYIS